MMLYAALWVVLLVGCGHRAHAQNGSTPCGPDQYLCLSGDCIEFSQLCDNSTDCPDGEDEFMFCNGSTPCGPDQYLCLSGDCIEFSQLCDNSTDCPDGEDEFMFCNGSTPCGPDQYPCFSGGCIEFSQLCDNNPNCLGGEDEFNCSLLCVVDPDPSAAFFSAIYSYRCSGNGTAMCSVDNGAADPCSLNGELEVFGFPPGNHTATITVEGNTQQFRFTTPEIELQCVVDPDPETSVVDIYTFTCSIVFGGGTPVCTVDNGPVDCELDGEINVDDFLPGFHIATITVFNGDTASNTESFTFITTGFLCVVDPDPSGAFFSAIYTYQCFYAGRGTPMCSVDDDILLPCELDDEIDVFDYLPGNHTATITVEGSIQQFPFTTPDIELDCEVNPDPEIFATIYTYMCSIVSGTGTVSCSIDDEPIDCELVGEINVFDFPPGSHTAAIMVTEGVLISNNEVFSFTTPEVACSEDQFQCEDFTCIPGSYECDGFVDCPAGTDEAREDCEISCPEDQFQCGDDTCIPGIWECDRFPDCPDGTDESEENCGVNVGCNADEFTCNNSLCISRSFMCDGDNDCGDSSDEDDSICATTTPSLCDTDEFYCASDDRCFPLSSMCDGFPDCFAAEDEMDCVPETLCGEDGRLQLANLSFVDAAGERYLGGRVEVCLGGIFGYVCDSDWDEDDAHVACVEHLGTDIPFVAEPSFGSEYGVTVGGSPVWGQVQCTGDETELQDCTSDLPFGQPSSDDCPSAGVRCIQICSSDRFPCSNGDCLPLYVRCNGIDECGDGSDERMCGECTSNQYDCGNGQCIPEEFVNECDGFVDCNNGVDELSCDDGSASGGCGFDEFQCANDQCISQSFSSIRCDGFNDCFDGSDERFCGFDCPYDGSMRILNQTDEFDEDGQYINGGLVQVCFDGVYHTICDVGWDEIDANIACRSQFGNSYFPLRVLTRADFVGTLPLNGPGNLMQDVMCNGTEFNLADCGFTDVLSPECDNPNNAAGVVCIEDRTRCQIEGDYQLANRATMFSETGNVLGEAGRIEVCYNGVWGLVCDENWTEGDAQVACRHFGYDSPLYVAQPSFGSEFGFGSGRYWLNNLMCDGTEGVLYDCPGGSSLGATTDCNGTENAAGIICRQVPNACNSDGEFRIANASFQETSNGGYRQSGRVDICYNGTFGSICDFGWNEVNTQAACVHFFGHTFSGYTAIPVFLEAEIFGNGYIWIQQITCNESAFSLFDCNRTSFMDLSGVCNTTVGITCLACDDDQFRCGDGQCLSPQLLCDGLFDCIDFSDEDPDICGGNVTIPVPQECNASQISCANGECISLIYECDGFNDCGDNSDESEELCGDCPVGSFQCYDGACIPDYWECNGVPECSEEEDEADCDTVSPSPGPCVSDEFLCSNGRCIPRDNYCDGRDNCGDRSDELFCSNVCSADGEIRLTNLTDGFIDNQPYVGARVEVCYNGSYGDICDLGWNDNAAQIACLNFIGAEFENIVLAEAVFGSVFGDGAPPVLEFVSCDGSEDSLLDCADGELGGELSDQCSKRGRSAGVLCISVCEIDEFACRNGENCVPIDVVCNGENDCEDMSDESTILCDSILPPDECADDEFECEFNGRCIPEGLMCNDINDCADGSDEVGCDGATTPPPAPPSGPPVSFVITAAATTALNFRWNPPLQQLRNGIIISYTLSCTPELLLDDFPRMFVEPGEVTISGFLPGTNYTCSIYASNAVGNGPSITRNATTIEGFQYLPFIALDPFDAIRPICLERRDDGSSQPIDIPGGIPVGDDIMTVAYVNTNGMISFGSEFFGWSATPFPSTDFNTRASYLAAPYWSDVDIRREGEICYVVYRRGDTTPFGNNTLARVSTLVSNQTNTNFTGSWMLLAHWDRVHPYPHGSYSGPVVSNSEDEYQNFVASENTYEGVIISDGIRTYAVYTHHCDLLEWAGFGNNAVVGYSLRGTYFANHPLSGLEEVEDIGCLNQSRSDWTNLVYRLSVSVDDLQIQRAECMKFYDEDIELFGDISKIPLSLEPCPCSFFQATVDGRFQFDFTNPGCFYQTFGSRSGSAQYCCYSLSFRSFGALMGEPAGLLGSSVLLFHPTTNASNYALRDVAFRQTCCAGAGLCNLFFERRPSDSCRNYEPVFPTWGLGDPHFTTLDGKNFTFNGFGEYTLLQIGDGNFTLQGRTEPASPDTTATVFSSFAFGNSSAVIEIQSRFGDLVILYDGIDVTRRVPNVNDTFNVTAFSPLITRVATNSIRTSFPNGVTVVISIAAGIPNFVLRMPQSFRGVTSGLLGNFNGDSNDDFIYPAGNRLRSEATDREIHSYGQAWQITTDISLFTYPSGMTADDFARPSHRPVYLDEVVTDVMTNNAEIADACDDNPQCIFDASQTNDMNVGMATLSTTEQNMEEQTQSLNNPPQLDGANIFEVTIGQESVYHFTVTDVGDTFTVELDGILDPNSALNDLGDGTYSFTWTLMEPREVSLSFIASDSQGATAVLSPQVQICGCMNNGVCTMTGVANTDGSSILLACECTEAWNGQYCEEDANGCALLSCFEGVQCFDAPAPNTGASCGFCPSGYEGDGEKCADINECNTTTPVCGQNSICANTEGGFECRCASGYQEISAQCQDINECAEVNDCDQDCVNTPGSYTCACREGFVLDNDQRSCVVLGSNRCPEDDVCDNENGICTIVNTLQTCDCLTGYQLRDDLISCEDIDECTTNSPCDHQCANTNGSFECTCNSGYSLASDERTCQDDDECVEAAMAGQTICTEPRLCNNLPETFECICPAGTEENTARVCEAVEVPEPTRVMLPSNTPQGTPAPAILENSLRVTLQGFTSATFDSSAQTRFKILTADGVTQFCAANPDQCDSRDASRRKRAAFVVGPSDVNIASIENTAGGQLQFLLFVLIGGSDVLAAESLGGAVDAYSSVYETNGFSVSYEQAVEESGVPTTTIIIAAVCGGVGGIVVPLLVVVLVLIIMKRRANTLERLAKAVAIPVFHMGDNNTYQAVAQPPSHLGDSRHYDNPLFSDQEQGEGK